MACKFSSFKTLDKTSHCRTSLESLTILLNIQLLKPRCFNICWLNRTGWMKVLLASYNVFYFLYFLQSVPLKNLLKNIFLSSASCTVPPSHPVSIVLCHSNPLHIFLHDIYDPPLWSSSFSPLQAAPHSIPFLQHIHRPSSAHVQNILVSSL